MQSNVILINGSNVELKLRNLKSLDLQLKEIEAEYKMIKEDLINSYFINASEYKTDKGLVLATYKSSVENRFNSEAFRKDFPDIYDGYKKQSTVFRFLLK